MLTEGEQWLVKATVWYTGRVSRWRLIRLYDDLSRVDVGIPPIPYGCISVECQQAVLGVIQGAIESKNESEASEDVLSSDSPC